MREFIKIYKDILLHEKKSNVMYKICCQRLQCELREINKKTRIAEHRNKNSMEYNHTFGHNWPPIGRGSRSIGKMLQFWMRNLTERDWCQRCYTSGDRYVASTCRLGEASQGLFSNCTDYRYWTINIKALLFQLISIHSSLH